MNHPFTIAIDVDLTVVDSLTPWYNWLESYTDGCKVKNEDGAYDLVPEMLQLLKQAGNEGVVHPFDFWKKPDLYDNLEPLEGAVEAINKMRKSANVIFVSTCVPEHETSKVKFLKKYFKYDAFIDTADKHFVNYDVLFDDKIHHIDLGQKCRPDSMHFLFTGVRVDGKTGEADKYHQLSDWRDF